MKNFPMKMPARAARRGPGSLAGVLTAALCGLASPAFAQNLAVSTDEPAPTPTDTDGALNVYSADTLDRGEFELGIIGTYSEDPTVVTDEENADDLSVSVADRMTMNVVGGVGITEWFEFGVAVPLELYERGDFVDPISGRAIEDENVNLGDVRVVPAAQLVDTTGPYDPTGVRLSLIADTRLPTSTENEIRPEGFALEPIVAFDADTSHRTRVSANAGYLFRAEDEVRGFDVSDAVTYGVGANVAISPLVAFTPELSGSVDVDSSEQLDFEEVPLKGLMGVALSPVDDWIITARAGAAFTESFDRPDFRSSVGLTYAFGHDGMDGDQDGDGVLARADECPHAAEDIDGFLDADGCPDTDNDADGLVDVADRCATSPEDYDGHVDRDGCPDMDNDNDGIADAFDFCPNVAEDFDRLADEDGCPDVTTTVVEVSCQSITLDHDVYFDTDSALLTVASQEVLDDVAASLRALPTVDRIQVQGYADRRGTDAYNYDLSRDRANAVRDYLVHAGVDPERLEVLGAGEQAENVPSDAVLAMRENRRVEFVVLDPPVMCAEQTTPRSTTPRSTTPMSSI